MYGQYFVMPRNVVLSVEEEEIFENGGGLAKKTLYDRKRECDYFYSFFKEESSEQLEDLIKTEEDWDKISKILVILNYHLLSNICNSHLLNNLCNSHL